jgi:hypothetical protein
VTKKQAKPDTFLGGKSAIRSPAAVKQYKKMATDKKTVTKTAAKKMVPAKTAVKKASQTKSAEPRVTK